MPKKRPKKPRSYILYSKDSPIPHAERWLLLSARETRHNGKKTSQYRGVSIYQMRGKTQWRAGLSFNGRKYFLGTFDTEAEAAFAWNEAALRIIGPLAEQRFNTICSPLPLNNDLD